jgi:hypothetical protein
MDPVATISLIAFCKDNACGLTEAGEKRHLKGGVRARHGKVYFVLFCKNTGMASVVRGQPAIRTASLPFLHTWNIRNAVKHINYQCLHF